jgi:DNA invertase Pin-like site-specific DNA recombinase
MMAVYGYTRVSSAEQIAGTSLAEQARKVEGAAQVCGLKLDRIFEEPGVSGSLPLEQRPAGRELNAVLRSGDTLLVAKLDRAFRSAVDAQIKAAEWQRRGVNLIVVDLGCEPVTSNGTGKLFFGLLSLLAEFERDRLRERVAEGQRAKKAKRGHIGGDAPFGYRVEGKGKDARLLEAPEQQAAIATMLKLRKAGQPLRKIAATVEAEHGLRVSHQAVRICKAIPSSKARSSSLRLA